MAKGIAEAIKLLSTYISIDTPPVRAKEVLVRICIDQQWCSQPSDAYDEAERWEKQFLRRVAEEIESWEDLGRVLSFAINSSANDMLQGAAFIEPCDSDALKKDKLAHLRCAGYCKTFTTLTPTQFECLCAGILGVLGVKEPKITPQSRDEGIDFYGRLSLEVMLRGQRVFPGIERQFSVWMIGQAKHFETDSVSTLNIRELVGSVILARTRTFSTRPDSRYTDLNVRACDPVFCVFITTGEFSNDALVLLRGAGIIGMDGQMVAAFLSERGIGLVNDQYSESELLTWLNACATLAG